MMPKSQLSMDGTRKQTSSGVVKRQRTSRTGQSSLNQGFNFMTLMPKPADNTSSHKGNIVEEIMSN